MAKLDERLEKNAEELLNSLTTTHGGLENKHNKDLIIQQLKNWYNTGRGWKRDRLFKSSEKHELRYKNKKPQKRYKK